MCPLETWGFKNRDTTSEKKTSIQIHRIRSVNSAYTSIWSHLTKIHNFTHLHSSRIGFGINKWEEENALIPPWKEIWSRPVWICIFLVSCSYFFFSAPHHLFCEEMEHVNKTFFNESRLWSALKHTVLHHILFSCFLTDRNRHFFHLSASHLWFWSENKAQTRYLEAQ